MINYDYLEINVNKTKKQFVSFVNGEIKKFSKNSSSGFNELSKIFLGWVKNAKENEIQNFLNEHKEKYKTNLSFFTMVSFFNKSILNFEKDNCKK